MSAEEILVLAPIGRDASLLCGALREAGLIARSLADAQALADRLGEGPAGALLLSEEALRPELVAALGAELATQPPWSDLAVVLLVDPDRMARDRGEVETLREAGDVTVLERPTRILTLVTAMHSALRARRRQYQLRDLVASERAARRDAEVASRLKDDFLATVSHELRTPLASILLWTRLLLGGRLDPEATRQGLESVARSAEAQSRLIEDLLDVSRAMRGKLQLKLQDVELAAIVRAAVDVVRPAAEAKGVRVEAEVGAPVPPVRADPARLQQVIWNLLSNAVKFTPAGGRVVIRLAFEGERVCVAVTDTGAGISPEFLPHVFERFRQADATVRRSQGGLGLGLAISRQLVELHGGSIAVASAGEGRGATFTVELPISSEAPRAAPGAAHERRTLEHVRVLLVEDDRDTRDAMTRTLEQYGASVTAVGSADAALDALERSTPPDVLLSDLGLPGMDGLDLLRRVRLNERTRSLPETPAALVTAYARNERAPLEEVGRVTQLSKPVEPEELVAVVSDLASRGRGP